MIHCTPQYLAIQLLVTQYDIRYINPGPLENAGSDNPLPGRVAMLIDLGFIDSDNLENIAIHTS